MLLLRPDRRTRTLRVLADPPRLRLIRLLGGEPRTAGELAAGLGKPVAEVSRRLGVPRRAGLATPEREGRSVRYRLARGVYGADARRGRIGPGCCTPEVPQE